MKKTGLRDRCCICGAEVASCNNPEPVRDGNESCCDLCGLLVRGARYQMARLRPEMRVEYQARLREMSYEALKGELLNTPDVLEY